MKKILLAVMLLVWNIYPTFIVWAEENPNDTYFYRDECPSPSGGAMSVDK